MTCPVCCVARCDFDLIEAEKPAAFRPLSRTPAQLFYFFYTFLYVCFVPSSPPRCLPRGSLEQHFRQYSKLGQRGFCMWHSLPHYWRLLVIFCVSPCDSISSSGSVIGNRALCAGFFSVAGQHCCSSMGLLCWLCRWSLPRLRVCVLFLLAFC